MTRVLFRYIPVPSKYKGRRGLSERFVKKFLENKGYLVWRGSNVCLSEQRHLYPLVQKKYTLLTLLLYYYHPFVVEDVRHLAKHHFGLPDFIVFKKTFVFVECKLGHEQLSQRQKLCIQRLVKLGFTVEVYKLVDDCTKVRKAWVNIFSNEKQILEKQLRLKLRW